ncbi:Dihydrofolate reductase [Cryptotermes secundus]|uniref:dihydrofolate reductase n=1 Tax=Cryptotermes secundus TaxID=105785 RepID=A0A2J7R5V3_9NEOP|nr:Dihydrofolate reductase [Cryptotermes secundus]
MENWTPVKLNLIAAADQNMGIGRNQKLPWNIPSEFHYFLEMTTKPHVSSSNCQNAIIIGHRTWETMDAVVSKPHPGALNIVLSRFNPPEPLTYPNTIVCASLDHAVKRLSTDPEYEGLIDTVWVLGGAEVYRAALNSQYFHRLYLSRIQAVYPCDVFFPEEFDEDLFVRVSNDKIGDNRVPRGVQKDEATGVEFEVCVYERRDEEGRKQSTSI